MNLLELKVIEDGLRRDLQVLDGTIWTKGTDNVTDTPPREKGRGRKVGKSVSGHWWQDEQQNSSF